MWRHAEDLLGRGRYRDARPFFEAFAKTHPHDAPVHARLGAVDFGLGLDVEACMELSRALELDPDDRGSRLLRAEILLLHGESECAIEDLRAVLSALEDEKGPLPRRARVLTLLAAIDLLERGAGSTRGVPPGFASSGTSGEGEGGPSGLVPAEVRAWLPRRAPKRRE